MSNVTRLKSDFSTAVVPSRRVIPPEIEAEIDALWSAAVMAPDKILFDGPIYHLEHFEPGRIEISKGTYRGLHAQSGHPEWRNQPFRLRALGVTGLLFSPEGLVLGRRARIVSANAGCWEPAPSGVLDRPDPVACLMAELAEELGLDVSEVTSIHPCAIVESRTDGNADLVFTLTTGLSLTAIKARQSELISKEYQELAVILRDRLQDPATRAQYPGIDTLPEMLDLAASP